MTRYVPGELDETVGDLSVQDQLDRMKTSLYDRFIKPIEPPPPLELPKLDFGAALEPYRQQIIKTEAESQRMLGGFSRQIGATVDGFRQQIIGGAQGITQTGGTSYVNPQASGRRYAPVMPDEPVNNETVTRAAATALSRAGLPVEMAPYIAGIAINEGILQPGTIARDHWSVGGVKAPGSAGVVTVPTREVRNGQSVMETASFGKFNSMQEGMDALAAFVRDSPLFGPVAKQAAESGDYSGLIEGFHRKGYATDPNWTRQVNSIAGGLSVPGAMPEPGESTSAAFRATSAGFNPASVAERWKGLPYVFGGAGGRGQGVTETDCSGFVAQVFRDAGLDLPAHTDAAYNALRQRGQAVDPKDAQPGDVVFYMGAGTGGAITHHMGLYAGPGKVLDMSVANGGGVKERPIGHAGEYVIMRDPRMNAPVAPQRAEEAPPIQETGIAEQLGGQKVKGVDIAQVAERNTARAYNTMGETGVSGQIGSAPSTIAPLEPTPPARDDWRMGGLQPASSSAPGADTRSVEVGGDGPNGADNAGGSRGIVGPPVPYGVAGNVEPGDFELPGRPLTPAEAPSQALSSPPPGPAPVEPEDTQAPGTGSGNPIVDTLSTMGRSISDGFNRLGELLTGANTAAVDTLNEAARIGPKRYGADVAGRAISTAGEALSGPLAGPLIGAQRQQLGREQIAREHQADEDAIQALYARLDAAEAAGDTLAAEQIKAQILPIEQRLNAAYREDPYRAAARNPQREGLETVTQIGTGVAAGMMAPTVIQPIRSATDVARQAGAAALDPSGQALGAGFEAVGRGLRALDSVPLSARPATSAGIVARAQADEAVPAMDRYYHGTTAPEFDRLQPSRFGAYGEAAYLTPDSDMAARYAMKPRAVSDPAINPIGASLRAIDVPRDLNLATVDEWNEAISRIARESPNAEPGAWQVRANQEMRARGFDGVNGPEGLAIFPESLDKIRNATAGTPGGLVAGRPAGSAGRELVAAGGRAVGAGAGAAYEESQREGATPESIARAGLGGAATSLVNTGASRVLGPGRRGLGDAARRAIDWESPYANQPPQQPASRTEGLPAVERARRAFVRAWTDDRVDLAEVQREAQRALGRPLTAPEMATELSRRNPLAAAEAAVKSGPFRNAVQSVGDDVDTLNQVLTYRDMQDVAAATGNPNRRFSGGLTVQDAAERLRRYQATLDPERWARIDNAATQIRGWVDEYRQRMRDAGVWSDELHDALRQQYPNYVPTRILDYMRDPDNIAVGKSLSLRDRGLRAVTDEGTDRAREQPLASLIRYAAEAETIIHKNQVYNAFVNLANEAPDAIPLRPVPNGYTRTRGEEIITGFENGVRTTYVTTAPLAAAVRMEAGSQIPIAREATRLFRELITRSPVFVAGQVPLDAMSYLVRETARESGNVPRVAAELVRAYVDAFRGLGSGRVTGDLYRAIREGGGMAGIHDRTQRAMATRLDDVTRRNMREIRNADDLRRLMQWVATFEWSQAVGQRVEMAPRLAAARLGEARALRQGADVDTAALRGVMDFRDVTLDFQRGGAWARTMNQLVPFFNVGWQSAATVQRAWRENPRAFPLTAMALIGAPTAAVEAWNRADPQREKDYEDVPDYVKDRGIVIMLPGAASEDSQGNRRPQYALIPLRELSPFAILAREATAKAMGEDTRGADALLGAAASAASPIQANNPADFFNTFTPFGISTGMQLATNRDMFRDRDIATERNDEEASAASQKIAEFAQGLGLNWRPSQVEFFIRDTGGYAGAGALAASDMATGRERAQSGGPQDMPIVGGLVKRYVGNAIGQGLQDARDAMISPSVRKAIEDAGMRDDQLAGVRGEIEGLKLTRAEQARYQEAFNRYVDREAGRLLKLPVWKRATPSEREQELRTLFSEAREAAQDAAVRGSSPAQLEQRFRQQQKKAS